MSQDFNKSKIYKITNDYNNDVYVGSTCDTLVKRFIRHKTDSKNEVKKDRPFYILMNEIGFERFRIELIEDYPCQDKYELRQREGHHIREIGTLNKRIEGRTKQEYQQDNKERFREYHKQWFKVDKEKNKEKYQEQNKIYNDKKKEYYNEKITCDCGCLASRGHLQRHKQSKKHIELMKNQTLNVCQNSS